MPDIDTSRESHLEPEAERLRPLILTWRSILITLGLLGIVLMAVLPPLLNVNRFKRRIVTSISTSLGRPVHLDSVSLILLPVPGFKLENFVVAEDPAFGSEPVIHANTVLATLRVSSLWRRKVEFSKISLQEPSINLVHDASGRWNVEAILLQAARIPAAPTAQAEASADPRFPYIEATAARVNIKSGLEKLPFSLTEADFALWSPDPRQWRVRLEAKPSRTDTNASDTGSISLEGSLGHAEHFDQIPLEFSAEWKNAPLGEASRLLTGRDAGLRGELRLGLTATGTIGSSLIKSTLDLRNGRRADFVPDHPLDLHVECQANSGDTFHAFHQLRCGWPNLPGINTPAVIAVTAEIPDIHKIGDASFEVGTPGLAAATLLNWLRVASPRVPADVAATGLLTGKAQCEPRVGGDTSTCSWLGDFDLKDGTLAGGPLGSVPIKIGDLSVASSSPAAPAPRESRRSRGAAPPIVPADNTFILAPTTIALGGKDPAVLDGRFDAGGYTLHLAGNILPSRLAALAAALPQFGDGTQSVLPVASKDSALVARPEATVHLDLTSVRPWLGPQTWSKAPAPVAARPSHNRRQR